MTLMQCGCLKDVSFSERGEMPVGGLSVARLEPCVPVGLSSPEQTPGTDTQPCLDAHGGPSSSIKEEPEVVLIRYSSPCGSAPGPFVSAAFTALDRETRLGGTSPEALCPTPGPPHPHPCTTDRWFGICPGTPPRDGQFRI